MKTIFVKPSSVQRKWYLIDAEGKNLGRLASSIASILRGKHRAYFTPHQEIGDYVIVVNADRISVTGNKLSDKVYTRHSGYPGGIKSETLGKVIKRKPTFPLEHAIKGMLPKNRLGRKLFNNVKVYAGPRHPHGSQQPEKIEVEA